MPRHLFIPREGWLFVLPFIVLTAAALLMQWLTAAIVFSALGALVLHFFRDRRAKGSQRAVDVLSPADGTIIEIGTADSEVWPGLTQQIGILTSIFDVHVNRAPIGGKLVQLRSVRPEPPSRDAAENIAVIRSSEGRHEEVAVRQRAGILARNLVFEKSEGEHLARGERIGLIRFGSRVDLFLPGNARIKVNMREKVKVGLTVVAELPGES